MNETTTKQKIIKRTQEYVKNELQGESSGHDWWHIVRVRNNALEISSKEKDVDIFVVELSALLHDIADWKFHGGDLKIGSTTARKWLKKQNVGNETTEKVCKVIDQISFKGAGVNVIPSTLEGKIVQDADKLDAIGAIGIARAFAYGGNMGREIYNPEIKPEFHKSFKTYKSSKGHTINHFYEKLLLLEGRMYTRTAKRIAKERHKYMEKFLERFYKEWDGKL